MVSPGSVRTDPERRRAEVIAAGLAAFGARDYDEVELDEIARMAGASRAEVDALFATKADLFAGVVDRVAAEIRAVTAPDPREGPEQQLRSSLRRYFDWVDHNAAAYLAVYRSGRSGDRQVRALLDASLDVQAARFLAVLAPEIRDLPLVRLAVRGWLVQLVFCCLRWLETREIDAEALLDVLVDTLFAGVASATRASADDW